MNRPFKHCLWLRFSLRTMLVLVTLLCLYLGWAMNWIRQREAYRQEIALKSHEVSMNEVVGAPLSLRILGENGVPYVMHWNAEAKDLIAFRGCFLRREF